MRILLVIAIACVTLLNLNLAEAAKIQAVKGKRVSIDAESDKLRVGQIMRIHNSSGKVVGLVKITKVSGSKAEGVIKGKAESGFALKPRPPRKSKGSMTAKTPPAQPETPDKSKIGVMVGFNSASSETTLNDGATSTTVDLSGSGFSVKGMFDYPLFSIFKFRGFVGLEQFVIGGQNNALCGGECTVEINYLSLDLWGRLVFGSGSFRPWAGGGFDLMFPLSKKATAFAEDSITNTSIIAIGGGFDWYLSGGSFIPVQVEYDMYPSNDNVKASAMAARIGYAWEW